MGPLPGQLRASMASRVRFRFNLDNETQFPDNKKYKKYIKIPKIQNSTTTKKEQNTKQKKNTKWTKVKKNNTLKEEKDATSATTETNQHSNETAILIILCKWGL